MKVDKHTIELMKQAYQDAPIGDRLHVCNAFDGEQTPTSAFSPFGSSC